MKFIDSINNELLLYYHFLDGYIDENTGTTINHDNITKYISSYKNISKYGVINIGILNYGSISYDNNQSEIFHIRLNYININNNVSSSIFFNEYVMNDITNKNITNEKITKFKEIFTYCIIQVSNNSHATSIVVFTVNTQFYLLLFNSGKGIVNHKNTDDLYVPYKGIKLCDDINDIEEYIQAIQKIYCVLLINYLVYVTTYQNRLVSCIEQSLKEIIKYSNYEGEIFKVNKTSVKYSIKDTLKGKIWKALLDLEPSLNEQYLYSLIINNKLSLVDDYYNLICKIISKWDNEYNVSFVVQNTNINVNILHQINSNITLSDSLIKKLKFHNIDDTNNIYIYPQQSGSCTWFSLYWPILFYFVINNDEDEYKNIIEHIIYRFYEELHNKVFTQSVFNEIINHQDYYTYMFKLYSKFVDLELFDNNLLTSNNDNYYNKPIKIEIQRYKYQNNITNDIYYIDFNKLKYDHTSNVTNNRDRYNHIFTKIFSHLSITKIDLYLFLSMQYYKNNLFSPGHTVSIKNITESVKCSGITVDIKHIINFIKKFKNINDTDMYYLAPYAYYTYDYYNIDIDTNDLKSFLLFMKY